MKKVDTAYFENKLKLVLRDLDQYNADELARELARLAKVADEDVLQEPEFHVGQPGWHWVPATPTLEMQKAYFDSIDAHMKRVQTDPRFGRFDNHRLACQKMVLAAPAYQPGPTRAALKLEALKECAAHFRAVDGIKPGGDSEQFYQAAANQVDEFAGRYADNG